jgi:hypothetical protein
VPGYALSRRIRSALACATLPTAWIAAASAACENTPVVVIAMLVPKYSEGSLLGWLLQVEVGVAGVEAGQLEGQELAQVPQDDACAGELSGRCPGWQANEVEGPLALGIQLS